MHDGGVTSAGGGSARFPSSAYGEPGAPLPPVSPVAPLAPDLAAAARHKRRRRAARRAGHGAGRPSRHGAARPGGRGAGRRVAGSVLIGLWAVWVTVAAWTGPWRASVEDLRIAAETGTIAAWMAQSTVPANGLTHSGFFAGQARGGSSIGPGPIVVWEDGWHRQRWADASALVGPLPPESGSAAPAGAGPTRTVGAGQAGSGREPEGMGPTGTDLAGGDPTGTYPASADPRPTQQARAVQAWLSERAGEPHVVMTSGPLGIVPGAAFWLAGLLVILAGPPPRHGNRWYWFWVGGLGYGVGLLAFALAELISDRPSTRPARSGLRGLVTAFLASFAVSAATGLLLSLLGLA